VLENPHAQQYPRSSKAFKIVHPHFDEYTDHILRLGEAFYIGRSDKGLFTIKECGLKRFMNDHLGVDSDFNVDTGLIGAANEILSLRATNQATVEYTFKKIVRGDGTTTFVLEIDNLDR
jgi:hypothetical protein